MADLLPKPRRKVEVPPANKDSAPQHKLRGVDDDAEEVQARLKDYQISDLNWASYKTGGEGTSLRTEMRENTSPAASMATKMKEMPRTVWWT